MLFDVSLKGFCSSFVLRDSRFEVYGGFWCGQHLVALAKVFL